MFRSTFEHHGSIVFPAFTGTRIMMMPVLVGRSDSLPPNLSHYRQSFLDLCDHADVAHEGKVGYLTLDEKVLEPGQTHRRPGPHVDGTGSWGGGGSIWSKSGVGMLLTSTFAACRAWNQLVDGWPSDEGDCSHLTQVLNPNRSSILRPNEVYWLDGLCVHESIPVTETTPRQLMRLSLPNAGAWYEGYTRNPLGISPTGPIHPRRPQMDS